MTASEFTRHKLSAVQFDALAAGGGDAETVTTLLAAERSWRLVQLRAVLDTARSYPDPTGPLPPLDEAWRLLVAAEQAARSEVEKLLLHPQAGTWAGYALRRLRGSAVVDAPLWVDLGYLHAFAAAAATRAGLEFSIRVPVREGFASLPTLGGVVLPATARWDTAEARGTGGRVTVASAGSVVTVGSEADGWLAAPVIRAERGGHPLRVTLEHVNPYRDLREPTPPDRLTAEQIERWRTLLLQAWELLCRARPELADPIARGLFSVVPQPAAERFRTMSASAGDAFGSLIVSEPEDAPELAVTLVHEFQHIKLGGVLHLVSLQDGEPGPRLYAPWRDDPRPLRGLLQGVYAFVGIVEFWRGLRRIATGRVARLAQFEFARWRGQVSRTLEMLQSLPELTDLGRRLLAGLAGTAAAWQDEPVPAEILAAAEAAAADHWARWRLHHLRPDKGVVELFAKAWSSGADRPAIAYPDPVVEADGAARRLDTRAVLALWRLTDPDGFAGLSRTPSTVGARVSGATPADLAHAAGDVDNARKLWLSELSTDPADPAAWAGLGLIADPPTSEGLKHQPELARGVYLESGATGDPLELAAWLRG